MRPQKRLVLDIPDNMHNEIKRRSLIKRTTLREYVLNAIAYYQQATENHLPEFKK